MITSERLVLTRDFWLTTVAIATVRMNANHHRRAESDRGDNKNLLNDIQGVFGELVAFQIAANVYPLNQISQDLSDFSGPVDDVDLKIISNDESTSLRIEVKCLLWDTEKTFFLINAKAHKKAKARKAGFYLPVLSVLGSPIAFAGHIFAVDMVDDWPILPSHYDAPPHGKKLGEMFYPHFDQGWAQARELLRHSVSGQGNVISNKELLEALPLALQEKESA